MISATHLSVAARLCWTAKKRIAILFVPWLVVLSTLALISHDAQLDRLRSPLIYAQQDLLARAKQVLGRSLSTLRRDVVFLANSPPLLAALDGASFAPAENTFLRFSEAAGYYDQIRWIDETGRERIRVNTIGGRAVLVPPEALQDKSQRPYFTIASRLTPKSLWMSTMDLNVEHGKIETPYKPTLRVATPVANSRGEPRGILILNYLADTLLDRLRQIPSGTGMRLDLLDAQAQWLLANPNTAAWRHLLGHPEQNLARLSPTLWQQMLLFGRGSWRDDSGLYGFDRFDPAEALESAATGHLTEGPGAWRLLVQLPGAELEARERSVQAEVLLGTVLALLTTLGFSAGLAVSGYQREQALIALQLRQEELATSNGALQESLSRLKKMQNELVQAEKLSALGLMVAGVAHELNTPIGSALVTITALARSNEELATRFLHGLRRSELDSFIARQREGTHLIEEALERASLLIRRFKQLAVDRATSERRNFNLKEIIEDSLRLIRHPLSSRQNLQINIDNEIVLNSYPGPLGQVIVNLVDNAFRHGLADGRAGVVTIEGRWSTPDQVWLEIRDDGAGIPANILPRIFDPFFTTQRGADGMGLGLHLAHQFVREILGGTLTVESHPGLGASFVIRIPRTAPPPAQPMLRS